MSDWIPTREGDLVDLCQIWAETLANTSKQQQFGWNPNYCNDVRNRIEDFFSARTVFQQANTDQNRLRKDEAKAVAVTNMREFANADIRFNRRMSDADRLPLGIRPRDTIRTDHTVVPEEVENEVTPDGIRTLAVHFKVLGTANNAKPTGYDGAVTIWAVSDTQPVNAEDYPHHQMASRTPFRIEFEEADRGKRVWIMQAWQNERGIIGRWSGVLSAFVP